MKTEGGKVVGFTFGLFWSPPVSDTSTLRLIDKDSPTKGQVPQKRDLGVVVYGETRQKTQSQNFPGRVRPDSPQVTEVLRSVEGHVFQTSRLRDSWAMLRRLFLTQNARQHQCHLCDTSLK